MYRLLAVALTGVLIAGCVTTKEVFLADGSKSYRIGCDGIGYLHTGDCLERAGAICGASGYTILDERGGRCRSTSRRRPWSREVFS